MPKPHQLTLVCHHGLSRFQIVLPIRDHHSLGFQAREQPLVNFCKENVHKEEILPCEWDRREGECVNVGVWMACQEELHALVRRDVIQVPRDAILVKRQNLH
jgi:hypothetical protein